MTIRPKRPVILSAAAVGALGLSLAGLNFGLVIGLFAGLISFVPFVGSTVGAILSVGLAAAQRGEDGQGLGGQADPIDEVAHAFGRRA